MDQPDALDGAELLELPPQLALGSFIADARHKEGLERVSLHPHPHVWGRRPEFAVLAMVWHIQDLTFVSAKVLMPFSTILSCTAGNCGVLASKGGGGFLTTALGSLEGSHSFKFSATWLSACNTNGSRSHAIVCNKLHGFALVCVLLDSKVVHESCLRPPTAHQG